MGSWALFASRILGFPPLSQTRALHPSVTLLLLNSKGQSYSGVSPGPLFSSFLSLHARSPVHPKRSQSFNQAILDSTKQGSPHSSVGKESTCNAGDPGSIPGLPRSPGEGIGYPLQYSWASLVAQLVKTLLAIQETWVQSLVWEDPLEKGKATHSSILAWRIPWTVQSMGSQRVRQD